MIGSYKPRNIIAEERERVLVLMPTYKWIPSKTFSSFWHLMYYFNQNYYVDMQFVENTLIGQARDELFQKALTMMEKVKYDYVLWLDSDHIFEKEQFITLKKTMKKYKQDIVSALYFSRKVDDIKPVMLLESDVKGMYNHIAEIPEDTLMEVDACGFGMMLMKQKVLKEIATKYPKPFTHDNIDNIGEDVLFFKRASEFGYKPVVDTSVVIRHMGGSIGIEEYKAHSKLYKEMKKDES